MNKRKKEKKHEQTKKKDATTEHEEAEEMTKAVEFAQKVAETERLEGDLAMRLAAEAIKVANKEVMDVIQQSQKIQEMKAKGLPEKEIKSESDKLIKEFEEGVVASTIADFIEDEAIEQMSEAFIAEAILETLMELSVEETEEALAATLKGKLEEKKAEKAPGPPKVNPEE
ncbi:MAG: hypothetical protein GF308_03545 [Candidatus Heimdallarchaeota archaeon]|nr:hypothetical protein [Candidatus Heimdallarchaeota archaeon]